MLAGKGSSRRSGWRGGIGVLAVLAIASGLVFGMATAAEAEQISSVKELEKACGQSKTGIFSGKEGEVGVCNLKTGSVTCSDKTHTCTGSYNNKKREVVPVDTVRAPNGFELTTQTVPDSRVWKQKLSIPILTDVVCPSLGGDVVASDDATIGACGTPTATIICTDRPGTNCLGIAETKKQADSIPKQVKTAVGTAGSTQTSPTSTPTPTTSSNAPPTTRKCLNSRRCPPPTLPPGKAPGGSTPVAPPQNR